MFLRISRLHMLAMARVLAWSALLLGQPQASANALRSSSSPMIAVITPNAGATPALQEPEAEMLLQADVVKTEGPHPAGWFDGFSAGESTFDHDGTLDHRSVNTELDVMDGWDPHQQNPLFTRAAPARWFQETKSGADKEAWQTFYPAQRTSVAGNGVKTGSWFEGKGGTWQQDYVSGAPLSTGKSGVPASWFDASVNQVDGFGRTKFPGIGSPRNFFDWEERSVNTSLECKSPGCTANVTLLAPFDSSKEMAKNCRLSVFFRPTDFDDQYAGENVEWIQVNNQAVSGKCRPYADGCNQTAQRPLLPCVDNIPIDLLMPKNGDLKIAAKIPDVVDECPYKGNMLSAVPMVTCLVALKHNEGAPAPKKAVTMLNTNMTCVTKMPLQCSTKGCASEIAIPVNATCAGLGQCMLSVEVQQTDFDNQDGTDELIEYIKVDGAYIQAASNLKPGKNPCKSKWSGTNLTAADMKFAALSNHAVNVSTGKVLVEAKISRFVDECASNGYLFDAVATVTCKAKPGSTAKAVMLSQNKASVAAAQQRRQLRVKTL